MRLSVHHITRFEFDQPSGHSIHDVRLSPKPATGQRLVSWRIDGPGKRSDWVDGHGNSVTTFSVAQEHDSVEIAVAGLYRIQRRRPVAALRRRADPSRAVSGCATRALGKHDESFGAADRRPRRARHRPDPEPWSPLHELMERVGKKVKYKTASGRSTHRRRRAGSAALAWAQDSSHIFIACCRRLGVPARYVSGYLRNDDPELHVGRTSHSWPRPGFPASTGWASIRPTASPARRFAQGRPSASTTATQPP